MDDDDEVVSEPADVSGSFMDFECESVTGNIACVVRKDGYSVKVPLSAIFGDEPPQLVSYLAPKVSETMSVFETLDQLDATMIVDDSSDWGLQLQPVKSDSSTKLISFVSEHLDNEEMGLIIPLGEWILNEACRNASEWINAGYDDLKVSVNVSANQFKDPGFKASVVGALQSSGLDPQNLVLEITESMLMDGIDQQAILFQEIKQLGVSFSLDDFGTGYSSLSYLKKFPIDELKIDRSFTLEVPVNNEDNAIIKAIIAMAHALGQKVVAEGVEEADQLEFLRRHHCDTIQGYYFSKPLNKEEFNDYLFSHEQLHLRHQSA